MAMVHSACRPQFISIRHYKLVPHDVDTEKIWGSLNHHGTGTHYSDPIKL